MYPEDTLKKLRIALAEKSLPGADAQYKMSSNGRKNKVSDTFGTKPHKVGAVLILLYPHKNGIYFPLTQRNQYEGVHSGQVSLPGGKTEPFDLDASHTALRETEEEIGVSRHHVEVLGKLTDLYIPPSNFLVHPYVGFAENRPEMVKDDREVAELFETDLHTLLNDDIVGETTISVGNGYRIKTPYFDINGKIVWGATAMILSELKETLRKET